MASSKQATRCGHGTTEWANSRSSRRRRSVNGKGLRSTPSRYRRSNAKTANPAGDRASWPSAGHRNLVRR
jgi:hypothetical protein